MSELSQGLLIAIPAVISAVASAWVAVHASRAGAAQAAVAITAEHAQWLRDKRCSIYQEMNRHLWSRRTARIARVKAGAVSGDEMLATAGAYRSWHDSPEANELIADASTYVSPELGEAFSRADIANLEAWSAFMDDVVPDPAAAPTGVTGRMTDKVDQAMIAAKDAEGKVFNMINADVTWTDDPALQRQLRRPTGS